MPVRLIEATEDSDDNMDAVHFSAQNSPNSSPRRNIRPSFDDAAPQRTRSASRAVPSDDKTPYRARSGSRSIPLDRDSPYALRNRTASVTGTTGTRESPRRRSSKAAADLDPKNTIRKARASSIVMMNAPMQASKVDTVAVGPEQSPRGKADRDTKSKDEPEHTKSAKSD